MKNPFFLFPPHFHLISIKSTVKSAKTMRLSLLALSVCVVSSVQASNSRPIIGIWAQPHSGKEPQCVEHCEYIAASYVRWVESAGGRAVPIPYNDTDATIALLGKINGVLFPGGSGALPESAKKVFPMIMDMNKKGDSFAVWGTCLGFEWVSQLFAEDYNLLGEFYAENVSLALDLTEAAESSKLYGGQSAVQQRLRTLVTNKANPPTMNNHKQGVPVPAFTENANLASRVNLLSTNVDLNGTTFASSLESKTYPMFAVQWHPEKNSFEWGVKEGTVDQPLEAINHSPDAVYVTQMMADTFINAARLSNNKFDTPKEEADALIYNKPVVTDMNSGLWQVYLWKRDY